MMSGRWWLKAAGLNTLVLAIQSTLRRPVTASFLALASNFLVLWSLLFTEPTGQLSLFSVFVLGELGEYGMNGLVNWRRASVLLCRGFACQHRVEIVWSEFNSFGV